MIKSYINNLNCSEFPELYEDVANIFGMSLDLLYNASLGKIPTKNANLQVIVKAANYLIDEGKSMRV